MKIRCPYCKKIFDYEKEEASHVYTRSDYEPDHVGRKIYGC